jgi:hypothetical protein
MTPHGVMTSKWALGSGIVTGISPRGQIRHGKRRGFLPVKNDSLD